MDQDITMKGQNHAKVDQATIDAIQRLKLERASAKCKVTNACKILRRILTKDELSETIDHDIEQLEKCMNDFVDAHNNYSSLIECNEGLDEYKIVNNLNLDDYYDEVCETYDGVKEKYLLLKKLCNKGLKQNEITLLEMKLESQAYRLTRVCDHAEVMLSETLCETEEMACFMDDIVYKTDELLKLADRLCGLCINEDDTKNKMKRINDVLCRSDEVKRQCIISMKFSKNGLNTSADTHSSRNMSGVHVPPETAHDMAEIGAACTGNAVLDLPKFNLSIPVVHSSPNYISVHGSLVSSDSVCGSLVSSDTTVSGSIVSSDATVRGSFVLSDTCVGGPIVSTDTTIRGSLPSAHTTDCCLTVSSDTAISRGHVPVFCNSAVTGSSSSGVTFAGVSGKPSSSYLSLAPVTTDSPVSGLWSYGDIDHVPSRFNSSNIQVKKVSLPEFSGKRRDWPEFKTVWRELAENSIRGRSALAYELKRCLKGQALDKVKNIYVTKPEAYDLIWQRLSEFYDDTSACVQSALEGLQRLKPIRDDDFKGLVSLVDAVESVYAQLEELGHSDLFTMREVDKITNMLPSTVRMVWIRTHHGLDTEHKLKPLQQFLKFLRTERASVARLAEGQNPHKSFQGNSNFNKSAGFESSGRPSCAIHKDGKHKTIDCSEFKKLSIDEKFKVLKEVHACFKCFGYHRRENCRDKKKCVHCQKNHNALLCKRQSVGSQQSPHQVSSSQAVELKSNTVHVESNTAHDPAGCSLFAIQQAVVVNSGKWATIFCDSGSNTTYVTHAAADRLKAKKLERYSMDLTTVGNQNQEYQTRLYELSLRTQSGKIIPILAFGMDEITGPISQLDLNCLARLFPDFDVSVLQRRSKRVDILLGCDYYGMHPKEEVCKSGSNLSIMRGELGVCVLGSHPDLQEDTVISSNLAKTVHQLKVRGNCNLLQRKLLHPEFNFIKAEELGTEVNPRCGSCKCGKCPIPGHTYSFVEEQQLEMIRANLQYNPQLQCWTTGYPWLVNPSSLPNNYHVALATLKSTEVTLSKDAAWKVLYGAQIQDMLEREVARKLSVEEISTWKGPFFYISHLAVKNSHSKSTPVRIVFNSSQPCNGVSLNSVLAKGPDCYLNNLIGLLLRWREEPIAVVGDIRKMFHSVHLNILEQHCHRFLWRNLEANRDPDIYVMTRVNMGDRPAPAICTEALYKTADMFRDEYPREADLLTKSTYVDDIIDSFPNAAFATQVTQNAEAMLKKGGFRIKCWQFSGRTGIVSNSEPIDGSQSQVSLLKGSDNLTRVLGVGWAPLEDAVIFEVVLNFSPKRRGERTGKNLSAADIPSAIPTVLTRRMVLEQVMNIFDPLGLLSPFVLIAKIYLRETWTLKLGWDQPLPDDLREKWVRFFCQLFQVDSLKFDRKLHPPNTVGDPWLILLSDGSDLAYGFVAYVRWKLDDGSFWCRLIMSKCRIAPMSKLTTPQMELNGAVLSKRGRKVIEAESRFKFAKILHLVDSETVLNMLNKVSTRFKLYEGVRIGEIQAATKGDMSCWAWISGKVNTADLLTRGCSPRDLNNNSEWWNGPSFLYTPLDNWGMKFGMQREAVLPGEKRVDAKSANVVAGNSSVCSKLSDSVDYSRFSKLKSLVWVVARLLGIAKAKSFEGANLQHSACYFHMAELLIVKDVQHGMSAELGKYRRLNPVQNERGLWVVGSRLKQHNPMTPESELQVLLPSDHMVTYLFMQDSHVKSGHRGRDSTLARFRQRFWVPQGSKLAWKVKASCQLCKLRDSKLLSQEMGLLPMSRLKPAPPFTWVMLDFFGPYKVRGEVQKRISGKAYGILLIDMVFGAVHIEGVFAYDTCSFLLALKRFTSIRGWPSVIYSDPGSQLVSAAKELQQAWKAVDRDLLVKDGAENGLKWVFGPADSPWHQGLVESLVKSAKRAIHFAVHNQRLSTSEFLTLCAVVANLLNERPIGSMSGQDSDWSIITPNSLLLGRATASNPGGWEMNIHRESRYHYVQNVVNLFWERWVEMCAPALVTQNKWYSAKRNLKPGDVVLVADKNSLVGEYRLGVVKEIFPGPDGLVRKVSVAYKNFKVGEKVYKYSGVPDTIVTRSVQRLALLVPFEGE